MWLFHLFQVAVFHLKCCQKESWKISEVGLFTMMFKFSDVILNLFLLSCLQVLLYKVPPRIEYTSDPSSPNVYSLLALPHGSLYKRYFIDPGAGENCTLLPCLSQSGSELRRIDRLILPPMHRCYTAWTGEVMLQMRFSPYM